MQAARYVEWVRSWDIEMSKMYGYGSLGCNGIATRSLKRTLRNSLKCTHFMGHTMLQKCLHVYLRLANREQRELDLYAIPMSWNMCFNSERLFCNQ